MRLVGRTEHVVQLAHQVMHFRRSYGLLQFGFGILASVSRNAPQSRYGVGTIDNGIDRPVPARPTLSLLKRRNGTAQFVPNPLSLFHANLSCPSTLDTVERSSAGVQMLDFDHQSRPATEIVGDTAAQRAYVSLRRVAAPHVTEEPLSVLPRVAATLEP